MILIYAFVKIWISNREKLVAISVFVFCLFHRIFTIFPHCRSIRIR
ncbi:MAG: hypothetical protein IPO47_15120 [Bacteroidetes bacterium]|nr:hypothetical protein [Bacteroidota bacterium]